MDVQLLEDMGLTNPQALAYRALIEKGATGAPAVAAAIGESRSNTYKVLDRLCELGLATKEQTGNKVRYFPTSPAALEQLVQEKAAAVQLQERKLNAALPSLLDFYFAHTEQAGIRFFQGKEGMKQIHTEMLREGKSLYLLRTDADLGFYGSGFFGELTKRRVLMGIDTYALTPDTPRANHDPALDKKNRYHRTWMPAGAYTAPVEWNIAGNKVALISYGEEAVGILLESEQIAESLRQVFQLTSKAFAMRRADAPRA